MSHATNWNEKVQRGRRLVTEINDRKWELGDLANEVCPAVSVGTTDNGRLWEFADEIGISPSALHNYRHVATQWPIVTRVTNQTWTTHRMLATRDDRHEIIAEQVWTYNSLSERLGTKPNPSRVKPDPEPEVEGRATSGLPSMLSEALASDESREALMRTPEVRRVAREAISDPEVARGIFKDRTTAAAASRAMQSNEDEAETKVGEDPSVKRFKNAERQADFQHALTKATVSLHQAARAMSSVKLSDEQREEARYEIEQIRTALSWVEDHLSFTGRSMDEELAALLGGDVR